MTISGYIEILDAYRECVAEMQSDPAANAELMQCYALGMQRICEQVLNNVRCTPEARRAFLDILEKKKP